MTYAKEGVFSSLRRSKILNKCLVILMFTVMLLLPVSEAYAAGNLKLGRRH